jgi:hypothetical protein
MKNVKCDLTENLNTVKKWLDVVDGRSSCRKEEDPTANRNLKSNITPHATEEPWITVKSGHKKPPSVNHASYYQIPVVINQYDLLSKRENCELVARESMGKHTPKVKNESRDKVQRAKNKHNFNLFCVHLIHRGYDPSVMELVNTEKKVTNIIHDVKYNAVNFRIHRNRRYSDYNIIAEGLY